MTAISDRFSTSQIAFAGIFAVTMLGLLSVGMTLPVLPRYVTGPLDGGELEVGIVTGAFAITGLACRPLAGRLADQRGRKIVVDRRRDLDRDRRAPLLRPRRRPGVDRREAVPRRRRGRRLHGRVGVGRRHDPAGAPRPDHRPLRARDLGRSRARPAARRADPPRLELRRGLGVRRRRRRCSARRSRCGCPERFVPHEGASAEGLPLISREALRPGLGLTLAIVGYATMAAFVVLHLDEQGVGHGAAVFTAFAASVVAMRVLGGWLPDRFGSIPCVDRRRDRSRRTGLLVIAEATTVPMAVIGAVAMGSGFSLLFPSLALLVVNRVPEEPPRRRDGHVHRLLRPRHGPRQPARRRGGGDRRLRGRVRPRGRHARWRRSPSASRCGRRPRRCRPPRRPRHRARLEQRRLATRRFRGTAAAGRLAPGRRRAPQPPRPGAADELRQPLALLGSM